MTELERYIQLGEVVIGPHPFNGKNRLLKEQLFIHNQRNKEISIEFDVYYLDDQGSPVGTNSVRPYQKSLVADTTTFIDPNTMLPVQNGGVLEYDYFVNLANNDINVFQLRLNIIKLRAQQGKFDN